MVSQAHALAREELVRVLTAYTGITTIDGTPTTLIDSNLIGRNDFITEKTILIMTGDAQNEDRGGLSFDNTTGTITVVSDFIDSTGAPTPIVAGTIFRVLNISSTELDVALLLARIGLPTDPAGTTTIFAWMAKLFAAGVAVLGAVAATIAGKTQSFTKNMTFLNNVGSDQTIATVTAQAMKIKSVVVRANTAQPAGLTSIAVYCGTSKVVTLIDPALGVLANIAATDQQVAWSGDVTLPVGHTIIMTPVGTTAVAVNFQVDVEGYAIADGGYLA
jgi:hypothetical protein